MAKTIISEGKTTAEAIEKGLKELNTSKNMVDIKVLENSEKRNTNKMQIMVDCEILLYVVLITDNASALTC